MVSLHMVRRLVVAVVEPKDAREVRDEVEIDKRTSLREFEFQFFILFYRN